MSSKLRSGYNTSKCYYSIFKEGEAQCTRKLKHFKLVSADDPRRFTHGKGIRKYRKKKKIKGSRQASG